MTGLVALIVCTNVGNLLMLRGARRADEIRIRLSLGASRAQVVVQLVVESAVLAIAGAGCGVVLSRWAQGLLPALMPASPLPLALHSRTDLPLLVFALLVATAMVLLFGVAPAIHTLRRAVMPAGSRGGIAGTRGTARLRSALVVAQLSLSMAAIACAGRSSGRARRSRPSIAASPIPAGCSSCPPTSIRPAHHRRGAPADRGPAALRDPRPAGSHLRGDCHVRAVGIHRLQCGPGHDSRIRRVRGRGHDHPLEPGQSRILPHHGDRDSRRPADRRSRYGSRPARRGRQPAFARRFMAHTDPIGHPIMVGTRPVTVVGIAADGKYMFDALDQPRRHTCISPMRRTAGPCHAACADRRASNEALPAVRDVCRRQPGATAQRPNHVWTSTHRCRCFRSGWRRACSRRLGSWRCCWHRPAYMACWPIGRSALERARAAHRDRRDQRSRVAHGDVRGAAPGLRRDRRLARWPRSARRS